jgi:hypothetical protein
MDVTLLGFTVIFFTLDERQVAQNLQKGVFVFSS